jgi:AraC-like DNA-binding protein
MAQDRPGDQREPGGGYCTAPAGLLPRGIVSTVGYDSRGLTAQLHRGLPSPYLTFIFSLGEPIVSGITAAVAVGPQASSTEVLIAGLHAEPTYVVQPTRQSGIQLAVHPLAARALFGMPTAEVPWEVTEGVDVLGAGAGRVREQLSEHTTWSARFGVLAHYLQQRVTADRAPAGPRPELVEAWRWLARRRGSGSMDDLAYHVGFSTRQLRTVFRREVGVSPQQVGRLMRFDAVKQEIATTVAAGGQPRLTELAHRYGYCDHPHLDREFRQYAGLSPTAWVQEERRNIQAGGHRLGKDSTS